MQSDECGDSRIPDPPAFWQLDWGSLGFSYCGVYVVAPYNEWPVKIGISATAPKRLAGLQGGLWMKLRVFHYWLCENAASARKVEQAAHKLLEQDNKSLLGEWFDIRAGQADKVVLFAAEKCGIELATELPDVPRFDVVRERLRDLRWEKQARDATKSSKCCKVMAEAEEWSPKNGRPPYMVARLVRG